jgi:L-ribulose-5-phosphate 3-epimerase UlaE
VECYIKKDGYLTEKSEKLLNSSIELAESQGALFFHMMAYSTYYHAKNEKRVKEKYLELFEKISHSKESKNLLLTLKL